MQFYLVIDGQKAGPYTEDQLREMVAKGQIGRQQLVWREGLPAWVPLDQVLGLDSLPPLPPMPLPEPRTTAARSSAIRTTSGIIALILGVLAAINIGGCSTAKAKLDAFETGTDPSVAPRVLLETAQGVNQGDPLRGIQGMVDQHDSLKSEYEEFRVGAQLAAIGAAVAGCVFACSTPKKSRTG